jgi:hypothetical protein
MVYYLDGKEFTKSCLTSVFDSLGLKKWGEDIEMYDLLKKIKAESMK